MAICRRFRMFLALVLGVALLTAAVPASGAGSRPSPHPDVVRSLTIDVGNRDGGTADYKRLSGADRYETAVAVSTASRDSASSVVIATGQSFPDALCGGPLAFAMDAPLLLVSKDSVPSAVIDEILRLGATRATILGGTSAVSNRVEAALREQAGIIDVQRIGGENRYETSALIADELGARVTLSGAAMIATGQNYPDALAVTPYAAITASPVLLVMPSGIPQRIAQAIGQLGVESTLIAGGTTAVSAAVASELPSPVRLGGRDRYETARLIAEYGTQHGLSFSQVTVAAGTGFADALAAGPFSAALGGPLVLTAPAPLSPGTQLFVDSHCASIDKFWVVGGETRVTQATVTALVTASRIEIPEATVVLDQETAAALQSITGGGAELRFAQETPLLATLAADDILVSEPIPQAPMGMLRKVVSVEAGQNGVLVRTMEATIEEALGKASVDLTHEIDPFDTISEYSVSGVTLERIEPNSLENSFYVLIDDVSLPGDGDTAVRVNGEVGFDTRLIVNMSTKALSLNSFTFKTEFEEHASIELVAETGARLSEETELYHSTLQPITVVVAGVPVVITPVVSVVVGVDGSVSAGITTGAAMTAEYVAGVAYEDGTWRSISERSSSFTYTPPRATANAELEVYAGPRISLLIYGIAGPNGMAKLFVKLSVEGAPEPQWTLDAGIKCDIGVEVSLFGWIRVGHSATVIDYTRRLAESGDGTISGWATNASRGTPVGGVDVAVYRNGSVVSSGRTSSDGAYLVSSVPPGSGYSVVFRRTGYVTFARENVSVTTDGLRLDASLVPLNDGESTIVVLTWGAEPWDLDSHMTGPTADGDRFHTYFNSRAHYDDDVRAVDLDVDDVDGFGPEHTTIYQQLSGVYRFSVHDYSNRLSTFSTALSASGAEVFVYHGNALTAQFRAPQGDGTLWTVFEMEEDNVRPVNSLSYHEAAGTIQSAASESDARVIADSLVPK